MLYKYYSRLRLLSNVGLPNRSYFIATFERNVFLQQPSPRAIINYGHETEQLG